MEEVEVATKKTESAGKGSKSKTKKQLKDLEAKSGKDVKGGGVSTTLTIKRSR